MKKFRKISALFVGMLLLSSISFAKTPIVITNQPVNDTVCDGSEVFFTVVATGATTYLWYVSKNGGGSWTALSGPPYYNVSTDKLEILPATSGLSKNQYKCVLTNADTIVTSSSATLTIKAMPYSTITPGGPISFCQGDSVLLSASGSPTNFYTWYLAGYPVGYNQTYYATETGLYEVFVISTDGCSTPSNNQVSVTVNPLPIVTVTPNPTAICAGQTATLTATPAPPDTYKWNTLATTQSITVSNGNLYSVTVTDGNGCKGIGTGSVTVNPLPTVTVTAVPTAICTGQTATLTATATPAAGDSYLWDTGPSTQAITVSDGTVHSVTVTDGSGCIGVGSGSVTVNPLPTVTVTPNPTAICTGQTATLTVTATPAAGDSYLWDTGPSTQAITVSDGTVHFVTVTDGSGCIGVGSGSVTVNPLPTVTVTPNPTAICTGQTATLTVTATPAAGDSYLWDTGPSTQAITVSDGTVHFVTVTDGSGCIGVGSGSVTVNPLPTVTVTPNPTAICTGQTATLTATATPAAGDSYLWDTGPSTQAITVSDGTVHSVTVTDGSGCIGVGSGSVTVNPLPTVTVTPNPTAICTGQTATLTATATPAAGDSYLWDTGPSTQAITVSDGTVHSVTVTDGSGCIGVGSGSVTVNPLPTVTVTPNPTAICTGQTATLTATATPAAGDSYLWDTGPSTQAITVSDGTVHSVTVTDGSGCIGVGSGSVTVNPLPTVTVTPSPTAICAGQTATLTATATPAAGDSYLWDTGPSTQSITVSNGNLYSVTVTDGNGCKGIGTGSVTVNPLPTVTVTPNPTAICAGQTATLTATATPAAGDSYLWDTGPSTQAITVSDGTVHSVTVTDGSGCIGVGSGSVTVNPLPTVTVTSNPTAICTGQTATLTATATPAAGDSYLWDTGPSTQAITVSDGTVHSVTVTDGSGCTGVGSGLVIVNTGPPVSTVTPVNPTQCQGTDVTFTAATTEPPTTYQWCTVSGGAIGGQTTSTLTLTNILSSDADGYYCVVSNSCQSNVFSTTSTLTVNPLPTVTVTAVPTAICTGQTATLTATATPAAGDSYLWDTGPSTQAITVSDGTVHSVTVTDGSGCIGVGSGSVTVNPLPTVTVTPNPTAICTGQTATLTVTATPAAGDSYLWDTGPSTQAITVSDGTVHFVTVTDGSGCIGVGSGSVTVNPLPTVTVTPNPTAICTGQTATLTVTATPAAGDSYLWDTGPSTQAITVSDGTVHFVTVTDGSGCIGVGSGSVTVNPLPTVTVTPNPTAICTGQTATLTATATPAAGDSYLWDTGPSTQAITVSDGTVHSVTVTDGSGCIGVGSGSVTVNPLPTVTVTPNPTAICTGQTATLTATATPAAGDSYLWDTGPSTQAITVSDGTVYSVTVTDGSGCIGVGSGSVTVNPLPTGIVSGGGTICADATLSGVSIALTGTEPWALTYAINGVPQTPVSGITTSPYEITGANAGTYTLTALSDANCTGTSLTGSAIVTVNPLSTASVTPIGPISIPNGKDTLLIASTGTGYTYNWLNNGVSTDSIRSTYLADSAGFYSVIITNGTCSATSNTVTILSTDFCNLHVPVGLHTTAVGDYNVSLAWKPVNPIEDSSFVVRIYPANPPTNPPYRYRVLRRNMNDAPYVGAGDGDTTTYMGLLHPQATYFAQVRTRCTSHPDGVLHKSAYSPAIWFTTSVEQCPIATNLAHSNVTDNTALLTWNDLSLNEDRWTIRYTAKGSGVYHYRQTTSRPYTLQNLEPGTTYYWWVKVFCDSVNIVRYYNFMDSVTTTGTPPRYITPASSSNSNLDLYVYPNPSKGLFTVSVTGVNEHTMMTVINIAGQIVYSKDFSTSFTDNIDLSEMTKGLYIVRIADNNNTQYRKIIIQ